MLKFMIVALSAGLLAACAGPHQIADNGQPTDDPVSEAASDPESEDSAEQPTTPLEYKPVKFNLKSRDAEPSTEDRKRCEDVGGRVQRAGLAGAYHCVQTYPDAGKVCRDSAECLGDCRTVDSDAVGRPGTGTCQEVDVPFGCYALVRDGKVDGGMLCVD